MVNANLLWAALSGFIGAVVMTICIFMLRAFGQEVNIPLLLGSYFYDIEDRQKVYSAGIALHLFLGACWGVVYLILMTGLGVYPDWPAGILWGFAQGIVVGVTMSTLAESHPYIGEGKPIADPGILGRRWSFAIPFLILGLHVIFGFITMLMYHILNTPVK